MHTSALSQFWQDLFKTLPQRVGILGHIRGDGDSTGSQIALTRILCSLGKDATLFFEKTLSPDLQIFFEDTPAQWIDHDTDQKMEGWIAVDCADVKRLPLHIEKEYLLGLIDHHRSTRPYAQLNCIKASYAATAELLTEIAQVNQLTIDPVSANSLYLGILTDTGQFTYNNTTAQSLEKAAYLMSKGANPAVIAHRIFDQATIPQIHLKQIFFKSIRLELGGQLCIGTLTTEDFKAAHATPLDAVDFVDTTRRMKGVAAGVYLEEYQGRVKASLRSNNPALALDEIAGEFGGGGHAAAAGFTIDNGNLKTIEADFKKILQKKLNEKAGLL